MNGDQTERLSQEGECREDGERDILEAASEVARRVLKEIEALAGTTSCKSVHLILVATKHIVASRLDSLARSNRYCLKFIR